MEVNAKKTFRGIAASSVILSASMLGLEAQAAEQIVLSYQGSEISVTRNELESFTDSGILPESIQSLLGTDAEIPEAIRTLLNQEIKVPAFLEKFLDSSTGEFVLGQLDDTISNASGRTEQDLFDLKAAFNRAATDKQVSFMEIVRQYPQKNVRVDLTNLEGTYNRVSNFVERVQPALEVAKGFLSDIICDCNTASGTSSNGSINATNVEGETRPVASKPCNQAEETTLTTQAQASQVKPLAEQQGLAAAPLSQQ